MALCLRIGQRAQLRQQRVRAGVFLPLAQV